MVWITILLIANITCVILFVLLFINYEVNYRELKEYREILENNKNYKTQLLADLSHNLRTPLNAIMGYTSLVINKVHGEINSKQKNDLEKISTCADKILGIIQKQLSE